MNGLMLRDETVLVVIDIQEKLFPAIFNQKMVLDNSHKVIRFARLLDIPILVTEQYPKGLGTTLPSVRLALGDAYKPIPKTAFSCFGEPAFVEALKATGRRNVVLLGIETHVCVSQTAITGFYAAVDDPDFELDMCVLADCVGSRNPTDHAFALDRMRIEDVIVTTKDAFFYEMLLEAKTEDHKKVFELLK